jgi:hypothetical protein
MGAITMNRGTEKLGLAVVSILVGVLTAQGADAPSGQAEARQVALDFIKAYKDRDKDRMLELSSVPWLYDFTETFKTRPKLEEFLGEVAAARRKNETFSETVLFANTYAVFRPKIGKEHCRKWLDQLLAPEDLVVAVQSPTEAKFNVYLFVRWKESKARIAGYAGD